MNIVVYCGSTAGRDPAYIEAASGLGARIAKEGFTLVYGGGSVGMMGAVADAALAGGAHVIGVTPGFMHEREWTHTGLPELIVTKDMHERKKRMIDLGDAFVALPGGTGTLEEITEAVSWLSLGLIQGPCYFLNIKQYYDKLEAFFNVMVEEGYIRTDTAARAVFIRTIDELFACLPAPKSSRE